MLTEDECSMAAYIKLSICGFFSKDQFLLSAMQAGSRHCIAAVIVSVDKGQVPVMMTFRLAG